MAIQITRRAIIDAAINVDKMDLSAGSFDFSSATVLVATPSASSHAATKGYVDSVAQGLYWKDAVKAATTANITLSGTQTIDGVSLSAGDRVLVKNQTNSYENGIYVVDASAWSRSSDMNAASEFSGAAVFVQQGTTWADVGFVCTSEVVTVGTDAVAFAQFTGAGQFTAGAGLDLTGSTFSVNVDDSSIEINSDTLRVKALGITNAMLAGSIENAKLSNSTISGVALGSNLNSLSASASGAITMTSFNGSAGVTDLAVNVDDLTIGISSNALYIKDGAIGSAKLGLNAVTTDKINASAVTTAKIQDSAITTAKIAADAIDQSKIADGAVQREHLNSNVVNSAGAIGLDPTNNDLLVITDDTTIEITGSNDLAVKNGGISSAKLATGSVTEDKIGNGEITPAKLAFQGRFEKFTANGSQSSFVLARLISLDLAPMYTVTVNGLMMEYVTGSPSGKDQYGIDNNGSGGSAGQVVFGANLDNGDLVMVRYLA